MQGFALAAITDVGKITNFDVNVDRRTDIWTPISHLAICRCDKTGKDLFILISVHNFHT